MNTINFSIKTPMLGDSIVNTVIKNKGECYYVGGCVRDSIMGITPKDWDMVTNLTPDELVRVIKEHYNYTTLSGLDFKLKIFEDDSRFGVVRIVFTSTIKGSKFREEYEIVTFRGEGEYTDNRRPDSVYFSDMVTDANRRDFTINAMYYNSFTKEVLDFHDGYSHIKYKKLVAVGNPLKRFSEDKLRILRGYRFAVRYGLSMDHELELAIEYINKTQGIFKGISNERILKEMQGMAPYFKHHSSSLEFNKPSDATKILSAFLRHVDFNPYRVDKFKYLKNLNEFVGGSLVFRHAVNNDTISKLKTLRFSKNDIDEIKFVMSVILFDHKDISKFLTTNKEYLKANDVDDLKVKCMRLFKSVTVPNYDTQCEYVFSALDFKPESTGEHYASLGYTGPDLKFKIDDHRNNEFLKYIGHDE